MDEFINTVDVIGDDELCDRIIMRTLTEYRDNRITYIGSDAFNGCSKLTIVDIPNVITIGGSGLRLVPIETLELPFAKTMMDGACRQCSSLKTLNAPQLERIDANCFQGCASLQSLILRSGSVCTLTNTNALNNTPIVSGEGYVYVPRVLVDSYKAATNWSTYATQFRALEDYTVDGTTTGELDETKI